jgi:hypothetical protein
MNLKVLDSKMRNLMENRDLRNKLSEKFSFSGTQKLVLGRSILMEKW